MRPSPAVPPLLAAVAFLCGAAPASPQTDEIQVYDGGLSPTGTFNLTLHNNFVARGGDTPAFEGGVTADRSWNGVTEWAFGVTRWFEVGLYLPLYGHDHELGWGLNGAKLRALFAVPDADERRFVYGVNFELSFNARRWDATLVTSEVRPIFGWHRGRFAVFINPIFDTAYDGLANLEFAPVARVAVDLDRKWAVALEEYASFGPLGRPYPARDQSHQLYAVLDHHGALEIEAGVGFGLTSASDKLTFKLILSRDLKARKNARGVAP